MSYALAERLTVDWLQDFARSLDAFGPPEAERWVKDFFTQAELVVDTMTHIDPNPKQGRKGGVMVIISQDKNPFVVARELGHDTAEDLTSKSELERHKVNKHLQYAMYKALSLVLNPDARSSRVNETLPADQQLVIENTVVPGGAFRFPETNLIVAFSGFSVEDDEAVVLTTALKEQILFEYEAGDLARDAGNNRYFELLHYFADAQSGQ